ncbi:phage terminase large subunit [Neorickettsia sennetsu]|uniref:Phage uncharacterized protein n=1 Tax=Ehrlichia sennetsu (strain ATCC VR-367 / Miyayama) TaxID=222891 RepID=Q2GCG5_EHRS3|nr:phage terminase large subunit [Neorickettsia sennetsu]ABD46193.1 phage uncharacterized protein [Neorickettsia sennetsu str. Miyayama]
MKRQYSTEEFLKFFKESFKTLFPAKKFVKCGYINVISDRLVACLNGKINRLIINIPPRHMKSTLVSVVFPAFVLSKEPSKGIIVASYSSLLSTKHSLETKLVMSSEWYKKKFKDTVISKHHNTKNKFLTTKLGFRLATSISGTLTGEGADIIVADDPINALQANSNTFRERTKTWFLNTFMTRLNHSKKSIVIIVMQRLHYDDICGHLTRTSDKWHVISLPLIAERKEKITSINSKKILLKRKEGEILNRNYLKHENIPKLKAEIGTYVFASQYQQNPISNINSIIRREWIKRYLEKEEISEILYISQSWDTAAFNTQQSDYTVCITFARSKTAFYVLDVYREKLDYPEIKRAIVENAEKWKANYVLIENKSSGQALVQELRSSTALPIVSVTPVRKKIERLYSVVSIFESGKFYLPYSSEWLTNFELELFSFPGSIYDDQIDSLTQYLNYEITKSYPQLSIRFL